jgi:hypothetical protein
MSDIPPPSLPAGIARTSSILWAATFIPTQSASASSGRGCGATSTPRRIGGGFAFRPARVYGRLFGRRRPITLGGHDPHYRDRDGDHQATPLRPAVWVWLD